MYKIYEDLPKELNQLFYERAHFPLQSIWHKTKKKFLVGPNTIWGFTECHHIWILAGDPVVWHEESFVKDFKELQELAAQRGKCLCGYYFSPEFQKNLSDKKYQIKWISMGVRSLTHHQTYSLRGYKKRDVRRAINQLMRSDLEFKELSYAEKKKYFYEICELESQWLKKKTNLFKKRIGFLLSPPQLDFRGHEKERWFVVQHPAKGIQAFVSFLPYKSRQCYYLDHLVQRPIGHKFAVDIALSQALLLFQKEGVQQVSLGMNFCSQVRPKSWIEWIFWTNKKWNYFYNSRGLYTFKSKFSDYEEVGYMMLSKKQSFLWQLWKLFQVTLFYNAHYKIPPQARK